MLDFRKKDCIFTMFFKTSPIVIFKRVSITINNLSNKKKRVEKIIFKLKKFKCKLSFSYFFSYMDKKCFVL